MMFQLPEYVVANRQVIDVFHHKLCTELFIFREASMRIFLEKGSLDTCKILLLIDFPCKHGKRLVQGVRGNTTDYSTEYVTFNQLEDSDEVFPREQFLCIVFVYFQQEGIRYLHFERMNVSQHVPNVIILLL